MALCVTGGGIIKALKLQILSVVGLTAVDQSVKLLIARFFFNDHFTIIRGVLRFHPVHNTKLTFGGNYISLFSNFWVALLINILMIFIIISGYLFYLCKQERAHRLVQIMAVCGLAGAVCSLIDKVFWGGSLDFLQIPRLFTVDLKDCYLTAALILFAVIALRHRGEISVREYCLFCAGKYNGNGRI